jgi:hypothetical protein
MSNKNGKFQKKLLGEIADVVYEVIADQAFKFWPD